jgi:hypothetical protein
MSCRFCKKRSQVGVPNWSARTRAVQLLLEEGFGPAEAAPPSEDEHLDAAIEEAVARLTEEQRAMIAGFASISAVSLPAPRSNK